ncbi:hypothetical protein NUW54_g14365 [Trametes sanguinea]|uniref:Uncharacterized protein n=1 Tax=Trametes sanguinea TaxID=158606 RepID=A0ACC1MDT3_9APHY|nr:hypothetical protein NUW54_g14365 [Trametes sanguinea]
MCINRRPGVWHATTSIWLSAQKKQNASLTAIIAILRQVPLVAPCIGLNRVALHRRLLLRNPIQPALPPVPLRTHAQARRAAFTEHASVRLHGGIRVLRALPREPLGIDDAAAPPSSGLRAISSPSCGRSSCSSCADCARRSALTAVGAAA